MNSSMPCFATLTLPRIASAHSEVGEGDDGAGTMEEDYISWKENTWAAVSRKLGLEERMADE